MFYGVINESYDKCNYLEMELENSLLFFKSLDVVQESGIQILQEGAWETIKTKISELWTRFKNWVKSIWEKIKGLFSKNKNTVAEIKETNDKIQKGEVKKEEPKKEESKNEEPKKEEPKEIKWYEPNKDEADKFGKEFMDSVYEGNIGKFLENKKPNEEITENDINLLIDELNKIKNQFTNIDIKHRFFKENTFSNKVTPEQFKSLADKITKASEELDQSVKEAEQPIKDLQEEIDDTDKEAKEFLEQNVGDDGMLKSPNGVKISANNFNRLMSNNVSFLQSMVGVLSRIQGECSRCLDANKAALKGITLYFS